MTEGPLETYGIASNVTQAVADEMAYQDAKWGEDKEQSFPGFLIACHMTDYISVPKPTFKYANVYIGGTMFAGIEHFTPPTRSQVNKHTMSIMGNVECSTWTTRATEDMMNNALDTDFVFNGDVYICGDVTADFFHVHSTK